MPCLHLKPAPRLIPSLMSRFVQKNMKRIDVKCPVENVDDDVIQLKFEISSLAIVNVNCQPVVQLVCITHL